MTRNNDRVTADTHWVWTEKAAAKNPHYSRAGEPIWPHYLHQAPAEWLEEGLIIDASAKEVIKEGQIDLFDYPGVI